MFAIYGGLLVVGLMIMTVELPAVFQMAIARTAISTILAKLVMAAASAAMIAGGVFHFADLHRELQIPLASGGSVLAGLLMAYSTAGSFTLLLRRKRMVRTSGIIRRRDEHPSGGSVLLISFDSGDGRKEFWARAGSFLAAVGGIVTVCYDPAKPAESATVATPYDPGAHAISGTVYTLILFAGAAILITGS